MANDDFFSRLIPPFYDKCRTMQEKDHHLLGLLSLVENVFKYSQKFTIKVSLSLLSLLKKRKNALDNSRQLFLSGGSS